MYRSRRWFHKIVHAVLAVFVLAGTAMPAALPVQAGLFGGGIKIPSASSMASDLERRYHVSTDTIQDQGETLNVSDGKKMNPQVSLFFSPSDPKPGEKITARAFPIYFTTESNEMYFTWYLQRAGCEERRSGLSAALRERCDLNSDGRIDVEDWKIEATRIIASNGYDFTFANYRGSDTDADGFNARFGGAKRANVPDHCYFHDNTTGDNYEIVQDTGSTSFGCAAGWEPVCMVGSSTIEPATIDLNATGGDGAVGSGTGGSATATGDTFGTTTSDDYVSGFPYCSNGTVSCTTGQPCCVTSASTARTCSQNITGRACTTETSTMSNPICRHLFAQPRGGGVSGDGTYGIAEEEFWHTDPNDSDTADNGNKDEANVIGLGQEAFTWNYGRGDKVGVAVEGTSMIPTKHDDASSMIMWALSKNTCNRINSRGSYQKSIKGYGVTIPTAEVDINKCLGDNLVDPLEGGQATNLQMLLQATPDDPINDSTDRASGDTIDVVASIENSSRDIENTYFDWKVDISPDGTSNPAQGWTNITQSLASFPDGRKLLSATRGNGVSKLHLGLNIKTADILGARPFSQYLRNGIGYLRFRAEAAENFNAAGASRRGRSDVVVKFVSSGDKIAAYTINVAGDPAKVSLNTQREICSGIPVPGDASERAILTKLDSKLCRVIKNEIIGLQVETPGGGALSNFNWSINGDPLVCNSRVSPSCTDASAGSINFFPVLGNPGDVFTITVTANRVDTTAAASTEKSITLSRAFKVVNPEVGIASDDESLAWPKVLGQYVDASGKTYPDLSKNTIQAFPDTQVKLRAVFTPDFLAGNTPPTIEREWTVDGSPVGDGTSNRIAFPAKKSAGGLYNISLSAVYRPSDQVRRALKDIWQVSNLDSTETYFKAETQLEHPEETEIGSAAPGTWLALTSSYLPASLLFSIKVFLSVGLIIFVSSFFFSVLPSPTVNGSGRNER